VRSDALDHHVQVGVKRGFAATKRDDVRAELREPVDAPQHERYRHGLRRFVVFVTVLAGKIASPDGHDLGKDRMILRSHGACEHTGFAPPPMHFAQALHAPIIFPGVA